jgi:hypothetical protein
MRPSTSRPFLAAKAEGGQRNRVMRGREMGEVEAGLVRLGGREVKASCSLAGSRPFGPP